MHCPHCGDTHGPAPCAAELGELLADAIDAKRAATTEASLLRLEVTDLRNQLTQLLTSQPPRTA